MWRDVRKNLFSKIQKQPIAVKNIEMGKKNMFCLQTLWGLASQILSSLRGIGIHVAPLNAYRAQHHSKQQLQVGV